MDFIHRSTVLCFDYVDLIHSFIHLHCPLSLIVYVVRPLGAAPPHPGLSPPRGPQFPPLRSGEPAKKAAEREETARLPLDLLRASGHEGGRVIGAERRRRGRAGRSMGRFLLRGKGCSALSPITGTPPRVGAS